MCTTRVCQLQGVHGGAADHDLLDVASNKRPQNIAVARIVSPFPMMRRHGSTKAIFTTIIQRSLNVCIMNKKQAVTSLSALAHEQRLGIFRLLVRKGPSGLPAGEIATAVGASPTAASFHLKELERAGLIRSTRQGRSIVYALHVDAVRRLLTYLTEDCCQGNPEMCAAPINTAKNLCCVEGEEK